MTIKSGVVLTLDNDTVTGTHFDDTASGATIQVDGGTTLKLDGVIINGGIINDFSTDTSGNTIAGDIDIVGSSTISNDHLNNGQATIKSGVVLTLDNDTVTGTHFNDTASGATIQVDGGTMLKLDSVIISGGTINDFSTDASGNAVAGDIDIVGSSTISDANLNQGNVTVESGQKLTLDGDTVNGTAFTNVAADSVIHVDGGDTLTLNDTTTITGGGLTIDVGALVKTSGDVTLTSTSVGNDGKIEVTDGILKITGSVGDSTPGGSGSIQIDNGAVLDLDASDTQNVIFSGDSGKLQIDTSSFGGYISGLTAGDQIDLSTIGYGPNTTGTYSNGILTITDGVHSISMTLTGDYSNAHFAGSSDGHGGTLITLNANDDVPAFAAADKSESATVKELADTTGSSASDPSPAASGTLHFTDIDLTDRPTVTDFAQSVTLTVGATMLSSSEIQTLENAFSLTQPVNTNNGSLAWTYQIGDSSLDFLGAGEKATVTSTITLDDHHGGTDTATVTVTVEGANDLPTIVAETDPSVQTVILNKSPVVLGAGVSTNSLELPAETFDKSLGRLRVDQWFRPWQLHQYRPRCHIHRVGRSRHRAWLIFGHLGPVHRTVARSRGCDKLPEHRRARVGNHLVCVRTQRVRVVLGVGRRLQHDQLLRRKPSGRFLFGRRRRPAPCQWQPGEFWVERLCGVLGSGPVRQGCPGKQLKRFRG